MKKERISLILVIVMILTSFITMYIEVFASDNLREINIEEINEIEDVEDDEEIKDYEEIKDEEIKNEESKDDEEVKDEEVKDDEVKDEEVKDDEGVKDKELKDEEEVKKEEMKNKTLDIMNDDIKDEGYLGSDDSYAKWTLDYKGNLVIYEGHIAEEDNKNWEEYLDEIITITVGVDGIVTTPLDMSYYFAGIKNLEKIEFVNIDTSNTENMSHMFSSGDREIYKMKFRKLDLSGFDTSNVTDMSYMFYGFTNTYYSALEYLDISSFDTTNVENMSYMFGGLPNLKKLDVSHFNTDKVEDMSGMFDHLESITELNISNFNTDKVTDMSYMFRNTKKLQRIDVSHFNTEEVTDMSYMFSGMINISELNIDNFNTDKVENMSGMFSNLARVKELDISHFNTEEVIDMSRMFSSMGSLQSLDLNNFDTSNVKSMHSMFRSTENLVELDLGSFNTEKVEDMSYMFSYMRKVNKLNLSSFETGNVKTMESMFERVESLEKLDLSNFDTSNVENMSKMFFLMRSLKSIDLTSFNTANVSDMSYMFVSVSSLKELDVTNFDTSNVINMEDMFGGMGSLEHLDVSGFNTSNVENMRMMFSDMYSLKELDVTNFDTSNVKNMRYMFTMISSIEELDLSNFDTSNVVDMENIFWGSNLKKIELGEKTIFANKKKTSLPLISIDSVYTGGWIRIDDENRYNTSTDFMNEYDGLYPGVYVAEKVTYDVLFRDKDKDIVTLKTKSSTGKVSQKEVPVMTKDGYVFTGWMEVDKNGNEIKVDLNKSITENKVFMATWKEETEVKPLNIIFDGNGGKFKDGNSTRSIDIEIATEIPRDEEKPSKEGYIFKGWTDSIDSKELYDFDTKLYSNKTLYAKWEEGKEENAKLDVTFDGSGGQFSNGKLIKVMEIEKGELIHGSIEKPVRENYSFIGWIEEGKTSLFDFNTEITKDTVLKASWEIERTVNPPIDPITPTVPDITRPKLPDDQLASVDDMLNTEDHYAYIKGYEDNTIRADAFISREEVVEVFYRLLNSDFRSKIYSTETVFKDVLKSRWSHAQISTLSKGNIIKGYENKEFRPSNNITRAEIAVIVSRFDNLLSDGENRFSDIDKHWAKEYINAAASNGWLQGSKGEFRPDDYMTRAEFITIVNRVLKRGTSVDNMVEGRHKFKDLDEIKWYYKDIEEAVNSHEYTRENGVEKWTQLIDEEY